MIPVKFRGWRQDIKKMIYPGQPIVEGGKPLELVFSQDGWYFLEPEMNFNMGDPTNTILMQFTGLKDKVGKPIYEGDIVNWVNDKGRQVGEVVWTPARFYVRNEYNWFVEIDLTEVIGNIYESKGLLTEAGE